MRQPPHKAEKFRLKKAGPWSSSIVDGNCGAFDISCRRTGAVLTVLASDTEGWEHVSVSLPFRCPTWDEMCFIKDIFWGEEETVIQFHPPRSQYVNNHDFCLHLWKPIGIQVPLPPSSMVGIKS